jgi:hypothetical protein
MAAIHHSPFLQALMLRRQSESKWKIHAVANRPTLTFDGLDLSPVDPDVLVEIAELDAF